MKTTCLVVGFILAFNFGWLALAAAQGGAGRDGHTFLHNTNPANPLFECGPSTINQMGCQAGVRCKCKYDAFGDLMRGYPPGTYRWDCAPLHGSCLVDIPLETTGTYGDRQSGGNAGNVIIIAPPAAFR